MQGYPPGAWAENAYDMQMYHGYPGTAAHLSGWHPDAGINGKSSTDLVAADTSCAEVEQSSSLNVDAAPFVPGASAVVVDESVLAPSQEQPTVSAQPEKCDEATPWEPNRSKNGGIAQCLFPANHHGSDAHG